ncbi:MAG: CYTH and CHAD domain-containing protein [Mycobacteriales bacterium]
MRELELKFSVHEPFTLPDLVGGKSPVSATSRPTRATLRATYYDTDDLRLARWGITLRRRTGGDDAGWHLKLPVAGAAAAARDEISAPANGRGVPAALTDLVTAYVRGQTLKPVATLRTNRESIILFDDDGEVAAELVDDTVSVLDGARVIERFREIEIESKGAKLGFLKKVGTVLEGSGAVSGTFMPKAVRALGSRAAGPPEVDLAADVSARSTAGEVVTSFLRLHVRALLAHDSLARQGTDDAVHQMRVAARQLRSGLKTFGSLLDPAWATATREELRWLATSLGGARDAEVMTARLSPQLAALPDDAVRLVASDAVERMLTAAQRRGDAALRTALSEARFTTLLDTLIDATSAPPLSEAAAGRAKDVLPPLAARAWRRLEKSVEKIGDDAPDEQLHRARIVAKQARYASEACALAFGSPAKRLAQQIVRVQDVLGEHQDAIVACAALHRLARSRAGRESSDLSFALGMLYCRQVQAADEARAALGGVWREVRRREFRSWIE